MLIELSVYRCSSSALDNITGVLDTGDNRPPVAVDLHTYRIADTGKATQKRHVGNDKGSFCAACHSSRTVNHHIHGDLQSVLLLHHHQRDRISHQQDINS